MAILFHDDCSSLGLGGWFVDAYTGDVTTDGFCYYGTQELDGNKYKLSADIKRIVNMPMGTTPEVVTDVRLPMLSASESAKLQVFPSIYESVGETGSNYCQLYFSVSGSTIEGEFYGLAPSSFSFVFTPSSKVITTGCVYKMVKTATGTALYEDDVLITEIADEDGYEVNGDLLVLGYNLYKITDTDTTSDKSPAIYDIKITYGVDKYQFAHGDGTEENPYEIWTVEDLNGVRDYLSSHFIQMAPINMDGVLWETISGSFKGTYDGQLKGLIKPTIRGDIGSIFYQGVDCEFQNVVIEDCDIDADAIGGGLIAVMLDSGRVENCAITGSIKVTVHDSSVYCGGLVGQAIGAIDFVNCYSRADLTIDFVKTSWHSANAGGICAYGGAMTNCYASNTFTIVSEPVTTGGLKASAPYGYGEVVSSYYDSDVSGQSDTGQGEPKTTAEMKQQSTYENWDFDTVWGIDPAINDGYPYLRVFQQGEPIIDDVIPQYVPQSSIKLTFTAGDSDPYDMGTYYADSSHHKVGQDFTHIKARNSVGKYLKDQSFDENCNYPAQAGHDLLESILSAAGLTNYYVAANATQLGFNFPPNKLLLDGLDEVIQYLSDWQIREEVSGKVVIAKYDDAEFTQPSTYTFQRDRDIFSREQVVDDRSIYGRVCVHTGDFTVKVYRPITSNLGWSPPARKTLYQKVPDGTTSQEAAAIATSLATAMSNSGRIETFVCAFRPQLIPGDEAQILDSSGAVSLGIITQVKHTFGTQGFYSEIVVDSGGRIGKIKFKDIVNSLQPLPETVKN